MVSYRIYIAIVLFSLYLIFTLWVYTYGTVGNSDKIMMSEEAYKGKLIYQEMNCTSCHQIFGLGGYLGPDLTNIMSAKGKGPDYAETFLQYGSRQMPPFKLDTNKMHQLLAYLSYVDIASGNAAIEPKRY